MQIDIVQGHRPPANPDGITVIIDVIRAFTTAHEAFRRGARCIFPVATADEAFALRHEHPGALLVGEIDALPIAGFDHGNSPWEMHHAEVAERVLIQRTTNGVAALLQAHDSASVLVAGLVNAEATAAWVAARSPERVVLVASHPTGDEDVACAEYMRGLLGGAGVSLAEAERRTRESHAARKFLDGSQSRLHAEDIAMAAASAGPRALVLGVRYQPRPVIEVLRP